MFRFCLGQSFFGHSAVEETKSRTKRQRVEQRDKESNKETKSRTKRQRVEQKSNKSRTNRQASLAFTLVKVELVRLAATVFRQPKTVCFTGHTSVPCGRSVWACRVGVSRGCPHTNDLRRTLSSLLYFIIHNNKARKHIHMYIHTCGRFLKTSFCNWVRFFTSADIVCTQV
jgi:hypothetical protein